MKIDIFSHFLPIKYLQALEQQAGQPLYGAITRHAEIYDSKAFEQTRTTITKQAKMADKQIALCLSVASRLMRSRQQEMSVSQSFSQRSPRS